MSDSVSHPAGAPPAPSSSASIAEAQWLADAASGPASSGTDVEMAATKSLQLSNDDVNQLLETKGPDDQVSDNVDRANIAKLTQQIKLSYHLCNPRRCAMRF